jgi:hypothetical protein
MADPTLYEDVALPLWHRGWSPVPLKPDTKIPAIKWGTRNTAPPSLERMAWEARKFHAYACGIAVPRGVLALDLDITDGATQHAIVKLVVKHFGKPAMIRVGNAPKLMLFFAAAPDVQSFKAHPIEGFCGTGQIAAFGVHHKTGMPYRWFGASPLVLQPGELHPTVTREALIGFRSVATPIVQSQHAVRSIPVRSRRAAKAIPPNPITARLRELIAAHSGLIMPGAVAWITEVGARGTERHNSIISLCGYLVHHGWGATDVMRPVPCINLAFGEGDWSGEVERAVTHAQSRRLAALNISPTISYGF